LKAVKLQEDKLHRKCDPAVFTFSDTSELRPLNTMIGQERAVRAMEFGLKIELKGYNIFMCGTTGTGKTSYAQHCVRKLAEKEKTPDDWFYVYNFDNSNCPAVINMPAGKGKEFQLDMDEFVKLLKVEIPKVFESEDYDRGKSEIVKEFQEKRNVLLEKLNEDASKHGFKVRITNAGILFLPVIEGKVIGEQEFGDLDESARQAISVKSAEIQTETLDTMRKIKNNDKDAAKRIEEWENRIALFAVGMHIGDLKEKYKSYSKITAHLDKIQEDILKNLGDFKSEESKDEQPGMIIPWSRMTQPPADRYKVNLLVDNGSLKGAPVVVDFNPTYYNLMGKLEYENEWGTMTTDFKLIKSGLLHQANGGYLILQAKDVLTNVQAWDALKKVLRTKQISVGNLREEMALVAVSTLKPEPVPADIKVILVGNPQIYDLLYELDEDFRKLFKIKVDFDDVMNRSKENMIKLASFISTHCKAEGILHYDRTGVAAIVDFSCRIVEDHNKLSTHFSSLTEVIGEASTWAQLEGCRLVSSDHVRKAIREKIERSAKYDRKLLEMLKNGTIMIDTEGEKVGQINGLSILEIGDYAFGKPSRITAATYMGEKGIVNIEREVQMSGKVHSKGVMILSGFLGRKYAQDMPLSLSASLCFEQLYGIIDGDSASSAELFAILSSLSDVPIKQGFAVTGSINQNGEIQPIGGASIKIEGFFELCRLRGLNGDQGVMIPYQNMRNLCLNDDVIEAVHEGKFNIYTIKTIDEGIELLTGMKAGLRKKDGTYPFGTLNYLVHRRLKNFARTVSNYGRNGID